MGYWWYGLAFFVHLQTIFILVALVLPFPTSQQWGRILKSGLVNFFVRLFGLNILNIYITIGVPSFILFLDCIREYYKYSSMNYKTLPFEEAKEMHISLLRAQRNYYISGSSSLLCIMVPTLYSVIIKNGKLESQVDKTIEAVRVFKNFLHLLDIERERHPTHPDSEAENLDGCGNVPTNANISVTQLRTRVNHLIKDYESGRRGNAHNRAEVGDFLRDENMQFVRDTQRDGARHRNRRPRLARTRFYAPLPQDERRLQRVGPWPRDRMVFF